MTKKGLQPQTKRELRKGADGRTAAARFTEAYGEWRERTSGTQETLAAAANLILGFDEFDPERLQQQEISQLLRGDSDLANSARAAALAEVMDVRASWLQSGFGPKRLGTLSSRQIEALKALGVQLDIE